MTTGGGAHPRHDLDQLIHTPVRLSIMAALVTAEKVEFRFLRDTIEVSDSLLSKHTLVLEEAGYVKVEKAFISKKPGTWLSLTPAGRAAFQEYVTVLEKIMKGSPHA
ncbi:MarR family transcriptional regulator [Sphaerisporangium krabiense]|uniref:DNA-binding MarR family transcriptional regulator n=1 Tax=Sphaerisporangium krabiense TaxID=763782 RepID=A0A7W9DSJ6_9ACTN|nr:transcriptional regulator [Sphaerisporangium krabiense]MBB5628510.1 DNA-binding MarR family transcriptional regulator [Sphaerisporangium krabiense]GII67151.1 MarR family transcriptional regulator [Sphaerisporangium krabiense]